MRAASTAPLPAKDLVGEHLSKPFFKLSIAIQGERLGYIAEAPSNLSLLKAALKKR